MQISKFEPILDHLQIEIGKTIYGSTITHKDDNCSKKCIKNYYGHMQYKYPGTLPAQHC